MTLLARDLQNHLQQQQRSSNLSNTTSTRSSIRTLENQKEQEQEDEQEKTTILDIDIDIGVTKQPYFIDKAAAIEASGAYHSSNPEQIHLTGYDTLIRIFNPKYYPPEHTLQPLGPFLTKHRLRVMMRPDDEWGGREEQQRYLLELAEGGRESDGARREWASRIQLVEGKGVAEDAVSSTRAREAAKKGRREQLETLVSEGVCEYVVTQGLYKEERI
jgi:nicotinamide-nucleotide adenylyltransferase